MSHEQTITIQVGPTWHNIKTVINGKKVSDAQAEQYAIKHNKLGKGYMTVEEAVAQAKKRSESFNKRPLKPLKKKRY